MRRRVAPVSSMADLRRRAAPTSRLDTVSTLRYSPVDTLTRRTVKRGTQVIGNLDETLHRGLEPFGSALPTHVSAGLDDGVAAKIHRIEQAHRFFIDQLGVEPRIAVLILSPDDWAGRSHPLYGMPNYRDGNLVLAGEPNPFWSGLVGLAASEIPGGGELLQRSYPGLSPGVDLSPFFDLLGVHELAHIFIAAAGRAPSRLWVLELACNVLLHAYVALEEPQNLPTLETFPSVFAAIASSRFTHRTLDDFERSYAHGMDGANYGWFQAKFHVAAKSIFDSGGMKATARMWDLLADEPSSRNLADTLEQHLGPAAMHLLGELGSLRPGSTVGRSTTDSRSARINTRQC
jgi:hypothetical protein